MISYFKRRKLKNQPIVDLTTYNIYEDVITEYQWLHRQYRHISARAIAQLECNPTCACDETLPITGTQCDTCQIIEDYERLTKYDK